MKIDFEHRSKYEDRCMGSLPIYDIEVVNASHLFFRTNNGVWHIYMNYNGFPEIEQVERR